MKLQSIHIDGALYVGIGFLTAIQGGFSTDDAAKYIAPATLWWVRTLVMGLLAGIAALKMFRSQSYSDYVKAKNGHSEVKSVP